MSAITNSVFINKLKQFTPKKKIFTCKIQIGLDNFRYFHKFPHIYPQKYSTQSIKLYVCHVGTV